MKILGSDFGFKVRDHHHRAELSCRRGMLVLLLRGGGLAAGKRVFQIPFAQWASGRHRVNDAAKSDASGIRASSHADLQLQ
jgi:hypothetical protein